ncbi:hypothetical protein Tco_0422463 [Tanacetum coccineum]
MITTSVPVTRLEPRVISNVRRRYFVQEKGRYGYLSAHLKKGSCTTSSDQHADNLHECHDGKATLVGERERHIFSSTIQNARLTMLIPSLVDASVRSYMSGHILHVHPAQVQSSSIPEQQYQLYLAMKADPLLQQQDIAIWLALQMKFEKTQNSAKRQKTSEYEAYVSGESSSGQDNVEEPGPSTSVFIRSSVIWERVHDFQLGIKSYQQKINLIAPTITFPGIKEYDVFSIVYEPVHGIIYTNTRIEKRVMRHSEIHKFCDATLRRTLKGLKSYYNDVKYGYVRKELTK